MKIKDAVMVRKFHFIEYIHDGLGLNRKQQVIYHSNRILVKNEGKTAAENCKAYIHLDEVHHERIGWMLPEINSGFTVVLKVNDDEFIDLCAIKDQGDGIITNEHGFTFERVDSCISLGNQNFDATIRITSSNAKENEIKIRIHNVPDHFPREPNRLV